MLRQGLKVSSSFIIQSFVFNPDVFVNLQLWLKAMEAAEDLKVLFIHNLYLFMLSTHLLLQPLPAGKHGVSAEA